MSKEVKLNKEYLKAELEKGKSIRQIAKHLGVSHKYVHNRRKKWDIPLTPEMIAARFREQDNISETELAYAAGLIDGEGCIRIAKLSPRSCVKEGQYGLTVNCSNTHYGVLEWIKELFGGHITGKPRSEKHSLCWCWMISGKRAADFLLLIEPYMKIKKREAQIAMMFSETYHYNWRNPNDYRSLSEEAKKLRNMCVNYFENDSNAARRKSSQERKQKILAKCA